MLNKELIFITPLSGLPSGNEALGMCLECLCIDPSLFPATFKK